MLINESFSFIICTVWWWIAFITIPAACFIFGWNAISGSWEITVDFHRHFCFLSKLSPWYLFPYFQLPCSAIEIHTMTILQPSLCISSQTPLFLNATRYFSWWFFFYFFFTKTRDSKIASHFFLLLIKHDLNCVPEPQLLCPWETETHSSAAVAQLNLTVYFISIICHLNYNTNANTSERFPFLFWFFFFK